MAANQLRTPNVAVKRSPRLRKSIVDGASKDREFQTWALNVDVRYFPIPAIS
jgi:hypothetical protein